MATSVPRRSRDINFMILHVRLKRLFAVEFRDVESNAIRTLRLLSQKRPCLKILAHSHLLLTESAALVLGISNPLGRK